MRSKKVTRRPTRGSALGRRRPLLAGLGRGAPAALPMGGALGGRPPIAPPMGGGLPGGLPGMKKGGRVRKTGPHLLHKGEHVTPAKKGKRKR